MTSNLTDRGKEYAKKYRVKQMVAYRKEWDKRNPDKLEEYKRRIREKYNSSDKLKEDRRARDKKHYSKVKERKKLYMRQRRLKVNVKEFNEEYNIIEIFAL